MNSKDYIGKEFDCVFDGEITRCKIVDECDKNSFLVVVDGLIKTILHLEEINLKNDDNWVKINKQKIKRWDKLLKEYHEALDQRYSMQYKKR